MRRCFLITLAALGSASMTGCEGCLELDDYELVPNDGGFNEGGGPPEACELGAAPGVVLVALPPDPAAVGADGGPCGPPSDTRPGLDVLALDALSGDCLARERIAHDDGVTLTGALRVRHDAGSVAAMVGSFRGGALSLPLRCNQSSSLVLEEEPGATDTLFIAQIRLEGSSLCTDWVRRAWTTEVASAGALRVSAIDLDDAGRVGIAGTLGGAVTHFEGGAEAITDARGNAFFARFSPDGFLDLVSALRAAPGAADAAMGVGAVQGDWLVTGTLRAESPDCYGCAGPVSVLDAAGVCPEGGGGGAGGAGGGGVGGAGAGGAPPDSDNAFLWRPGASGSCTQLSTFGSDRKGDGDAQVGFGVSVASWSSLCASYWTGFAGRDPWRLMDNDPSTALYDTGGLTRDGFIARLDGGSTVGCGPGGAAWSVRLAPAQSDAIVSGAQIEATRCSEGATAILFTRGETGGRVDLHRCQTGAACEPSIASLVLTTGADPALAVVGLRGDGGLDWQGAFGPIDVDPEAAAGSPAGKPIAALDLDVSDFVYLVLRTTGPLRVQGVERSGCAELADGAAAGTWALRLERDGSQGQARCGWAKRLSPSPVR